jgi:group I intron endonuclease
VSIEIQSDTRQTIVNAFKLKYGNSVYKTGIYLISFLNSTESYIGYTTQQGKYLSGCGFYKRWTTHIRSLETQSHYNRFLQRTCNKYGLENIQFDILEIIDSIEECVEKEPVYIRNYNTSTNYILNKQVPYRHFYTESEREHRRQSLIGRKHTELTKSRISNSHKGKTYDRLNISNSDITESIVNILNGSTFKLESIRLNVSINPFKAKMKLLSDNFGELVSTSLVNSRTIKGLKCRGISQKKSYTPETVDEIVRLYKQGYLISSIRSIVNLNTDLIGQIIRNVLTFEEYKCIRNSNMKRK